MTNKVPSGIEWVRVRRLGTRTTSPSKLVAYVDEAGRRQARLSVARDMIEKAGFKFGDHLVCLQGREPHNQWLRIEKTDKGGVTYKKDKPPVFSIGSYLSSDLDVNEAVEPQFGKDAIYFELRKKWVK